MRFKLNENRIDNLNRRIQNRDLSNYENDSIDPYEQKRNRDFIRYIENTCTVGLLSLEEDRKIEEDISSGIITKDILLWPNADSDCWWLSSHPSNFCSDHAAYVGYYGYSSNYGTGVNDDCCSVRPTLRITSKILTPYDEYNVYDEPWIAISKDCLLYNGDKCIKHRFDEETNEYEYSEIKRYLESGEWLNEIRSM